MNDTKRMTPELQEALKYKPSQDGGIFWIDLDSLCEYFEGIYLNWYPGSFPNFAALHRLWVSYGPANDSILAAHNPQFQLTVNVKNHSVSKPAKKLKYGVVWVVLTRHVYQKTQILSHNKGDFLTLHVFDRRKGQLVLYPNKALINGVYSNNPHVLCRLQAPVGHNEYTLVVSAYEKDNKNGKSYTLSVYSTENCTPAPGITQIANRLPHFQKVNSDWIGQRAGGTLMDKQSYLNNPKFTIVTTAPGLVRIRLMTQKEIYCNVAVFNTTSLKDIGKRTEIASSGDYRHGFCYAEIPTLQPGTYLVIPSAFEKGKMGSVVLEFESVVDFKVAPLRG